MQTSDTHAAIQRFLKASRQPVFLEPGEPPIPLVDGSYSLELRNGRLMLQVWDERRNSVRRVTGLYLEKPGKLELIVERFGKREGRLSLIDLARPSNRSAERRGERLVFRERFRGFLQRAFPDSNIADLSAEPDLEHSLSPSYPRALLKKGSSAAWAAIAADAGAADGLLSFGLIWLDYVRRRNPRIAVEGLALFLPVAEMRSTCLRLLFLDKSAAQFAVFAYSDEDYTEPADPRDYGNLDTRLETQASAAAQIHRDALASLTRLPGVETAAKGDGSVSFRVRGLEFASAAGGQLSFGIDQKTPAADSSAGEIEALARELARLRSPDSPDRQNPLYCRRPEGWLESQVRRHLEDVDATLLPSPVYGQVPAFAGGDRGVMDLLAADRSGRLAVLELKASEDIHLPLQGLDYWMRVKWHAGRGDFPVHGYFPGVQLKRDPPRLLFIAPALDFHPTTETILRFFAPEVEVERIGLGVEWRKQIKVMFRAYGAAKPA